MPFVRLLHRNSWPAYLFLNVLYNHVSRIPTGRVATNFSEANAITRRDVKPPAPEAIVFIVLIPILVLLSGLFAGLTLGYMSLDETQLNVLSISGTP